MNAKQKKFADYYLKTLNATESAKKAGYSKKTAYSQGQRLLKNDEVCEYLEKRMQKQENKRIASLEEVLEFLTDTMKDRRNKTNDRVKAAELLGKRYAAFTDNTNHTGDIEVVVTIDDD